MCSLSLRITHMCIKNYICVHVLQQFNCGVNGWWVMIENIFSLFLKIVVTAGESVLVVKCSKIWLIEERKSYYIYTELSLHKCGETFWSWPLVLEVTGVKSTGEISIWLFQYGLIEQDGARYLSSDSKLDKFRLESMSESGSNCMAIMNLADCLCSYWAFSCPE